MKWAQQPCLYSLSGFVAYGKFTWTQKEEIRGLDLMYLSDGHLPSSGPSSTSGWGACCPEQSVLTTANNHHTLSGKLSPSSSIKPIHSSNQHAVYMSWVSSVLALKKSEPNNIPPSLASGLHETMAKGNQRWKTKGLAEAVSGHRYRAERTAQEMS